MKLRIKGPGPKTRRITSTIFTALSMIVVVLVFFALTLRFALHTREVAIPDFAGMTVPEASTAALHSNLDLNIENRFYSTTVPAGRILSQAPAAGSHVRKGWQVRVTESLGPQQVTIPDVVGEPVRQATMDLRRTQLDPGIQAHLDAPGDTDMVLAQTPPPSAGVDQPRVNLLVSTTGEGASTAFVMPSFVGMSFTAANHAAIALGLKVAAIGGTVAPPTPIPTAPPSPTPAATQGIPAPLTLSQPAPVVPAGPSGPVNAQSPPAGYRANKGSTIRLIFNTPSSSTPTPAPQAP
jgi:eukaryotic-like serine/threonine-protein kinase